jgi:multidrug efflux pump subunit AcrA (membrane-fusion protein)
MRSLPILILLLLSIIPSVAVAAPPGSGSELLPLVTVAPVTIENINPPTEYIGHVEAIQSVDLRARVEGFLEQINFNEGENVLAGKLLYVIEQAPYLSKVAIDKAHMAQAEAELTRANQHLKRLRSVLSASIPATDIDDAVAAQLSAEATRPRIHQHQGANQWTHWAHHLHSRKFGWPGIQAPGADYSDGPYPRGLLYQRQ